MALLSFHNIHLAGIAAAVPEHEESNEDYPFGSHQERDLFIRTTGVAHRRRSKELLCSDLCFEAAQRLLEKLQWRRDEVQLLIFVSQSRDYILPMTANLLQTRLGLPDSCIAFDVPVGCSGYVYGLSMVAAYLSSGQIKKALMLAGDTSTFTTNPGDKSTYPLFGDAGSATALEYRDGAPAWHFELGTDGSGAQHISIPGGHCRTPFSRTSLDDVNIAPGITRNQTNLQLNGEEVFYFSVTRVPQAVQALLAARQTSFEHIDYWLMHQANKIMNETIRMKMKVDATKVPYSLEDFGNTSSASIPLTMVLHAAQNPFTDKTLLLSGFGVGLSWGNLLLPASRFELLPLISL